MKLSIGTLGLAALAVSPLWIVARTVTDAKTAVGAGIMTNICMTCGHPTVTGLLCVTCRSVTESKTGFSSPLVVTRGGIPCEDQVSALEEFKQACRPRLDHEDYERIRETLDSLNDNPTEEEAEAILQAHGTSGKEVVNGFIEQLLVENSNLKQRLAQAQEEIDYAAKLANRKAEEVKTEIQRAFAFKQNCDALVRQLGQIKSEIGGRIALARAEKERAEQGGYDRDALRLDGAIATLESLLEDIYPDAIERDD